MDGSAPASPRRSRSKGGDAEGAPPEGDALQGGDTGGIAAKKLKSFVERIERLETEKADLGADIREIYAEAKGSGF